MKPTTPISASNSGIMLCTTIIIITWLFSALGLSQAVASQDIVAVAQIFGGATGITLASMAVRYLAQMRNVLAIRYNNEVLRLPLQREAKAVK